MPWVFSIHVIQKKNPVRSLGFDPVKDKTPFKSLTSCPQETVCAPPTLVLVFTAPEGPRGSRMRGAVGAGKGLCLQNAEVT